MIKLSHVSKSFDGGRSYSVKDVSFEVMQGEILVILGSSGSGKTTLLKMINALIPASQGSIAIGGKDIQEVDPVELKRSMGYVFQGIGLFPHLTVAENIAIILRLLKVPVAKRKQRAAELLKFINLDPSIYADRMPAELSGGQQQRVGVARALANNPDILLMDEPFAALDSINRDALQQDLLDLHKRLHKTIMFVTHDIFEAMRIADRIAVMHNGCLEQIGLKAELVTNPASDFVRELFAKPAKQLAMFEEQLA